MEEVFIKAHDGYNLCLNIYEAENPKAVVQIAHGMEEHQGRYKSFAGMLVSNGYIVVSADMRGHGKMAKTLGFFKRQNGYKSLINDQVRVTKYIKERYQNLNLFLFAHSMGSIISRVVLQNYSKLYDKVVFSGYPNYRAAAKLGIKIANSLTEKHSSKYKSKLLTSIEFKFFNFMVWNPKTKVDWMCYNRDVIDEYLKDPLCGFGFTSSAFSDLFTLVVIMNDYKKYKKVNPNLSMLFIRGANDPSTGGVSGSTKSVEVMKKAGFKNITKIDYQKMRHEVINEKENQMVYDDILSFFEA